MKKSRLTTLDKTWSVARWVSNSARRSTLLSLLVVVVFGGCGSDSLSLVQLGGQTMGTTYHVSYGEPDSVASPESIQVAIDSALVALNASVSTYIDSSIISVINASSDTTVWHPVDIHFSTIFVASKRIYTDTKGAFNPAIGPLVRAWGFGPVDTSSIPDSAAVDSLLALVDFESFELDSTLAFVRKSNPGANLDFSAIAKGYGVDVVAELLAAHGISDYFVEIGGEVRTQGQHPAGRPWKVGIEKPAVDAMSEQETQEIVPMINRSMATSGNYRNYHEVEGRRYAHIIDPTTGYSRSSSLLSVSVIADNCMTADAYATAFMVMGEEGARAFVASRPGLEAFFILGTESGEFAETRSTGFPYGE